MKYFIIPLQLYSYLIFCVYHIFRRKHAMSVTASTETKNEIEPYAEFVEPKYEQVLGNSRKNYENIGEDYENAKQKEHYEFVNPNINP